MTGKTKVPIDTVDKGDEEIEEKSDGLEPEDNAEADAASEGDEAKPDPSVRIAELEERLKYEHERMLRFAAELDNLRKRTQRDLGEAAIKGRAEVLSEIVPTLDNLNLAIGSAQSENQGDCILQGVELVKKQLLLAMERFGLKQMESIGKAFDPALHEAVAQVVSDDAEPGRVIHEMRSGYMLGDRLLRPAMVVVSRARPETAEPEISGDAESGQTEVQSGEEPSTDAKDGEVDGELNGENTNE